MVGEIVMCCKHIGCLANGLTHCMLGTATDFHARAFAASATCKSLPVAPRVPVAHAFARQQVQVNQGEWLHVD